MSASAYKCLGDSKYNTVVRGVITVEVAMKVRRSSIAATTAREDV